MLKVILMTDDDPVDSWVAHQLAQQFPIAHSILLKSSPDHSSLSLRQKILSSPLRVLSAIPRELIRKRVEAQRESLVGEQLWGKDKPVLDEVLPNVIAIQTEQINSTAAAQQIQDLSPDLILVCGGPILKESLYSIPRLGCWNLQWGISDRYRGQHGIFFPLALGEFDGIGATLHRIDSGINTGEALLQLYPALEPGDTELFIEMKIAKSIVPQLVQRLKTLQEAPYTEFVQGKVIDKQVGKTIRYRDRTAWLEIQYYLKRKLSFSPVPARPEKQHLFLGCLAGVPMA